MPILGVENAQYLTGNGHILYLFKTEKYYLYDCFINTCKSITYGEGFSRFLCKTNVRLNLADSDLAENLHRNRLTMSNIGILNFF